MAKVNYLEVCQMLSKHQIGEIKARMTNLIARKAAIATENKDIDELLDELLKQIEKGESFTKEYMSHSEEMGTYK